MYTAECLDFAPFFLSNGSRHFGLTVALTFGVSPVYPLSLPVLGLGIFWPLDRAPDFPLVALSIINPQWVDTQ